MVNIHTYIGVRKDECQEFLRPVKFLWGWMSFWTQCQGPRGCLKELSWAETLTSDSPSNQRAISVRGPGLTQEVDYYIYWPWIWVKKLSKPLKDSKKTIGLQQDTNYKASWRLWLSSPSVLFCQSAGQCQVRANSSHPCCIFLCWNLYYF